MVKTVYTFGAWDILHMGHINYLEKARSFGDLLVVGVQDDESILKCKDIGASVGGEQRRDVVASLKCVDRAELYQFNYLEKFKSSGASILAMCEDHRNGERFKELYDYVRHTYGDAAIRFVPYDKEVSSTSIKDTIKNASWDNIWDGVAGNSEKNDYEICGYSSMDDVKLMADYMARQIGLCHSSKVLDYGCGSGVILKNLNVKDGSIGIDVSREMIDRAYKNNPNHTFFVSNRPNIRCSNIDIAICWGVLHYLPSIDHARVVVEDMLKLSDNILIMEIPDLSKKQEREANRRKLGMNPFPEHIYFSRKFFEDFGFECYDNDIFLTKNSNYSFTARRKK